MKRKIKRLELHRETLRNLAAGELHPVVGGATEGGASCLRQRCETDTCLPSCHGLSCRIACPTDIC